MANDTHRRDAFIRRLVSQLAGIARAKGLVDSAVALNRLSYVRGAFDALRFANALPDDDLSGELHAALNSASARDWRQEPLGLEFEMIHPSSSVREMVSSTPRTILSDAVGGDEERGISARLLGIDVLRHLTMVRWLVVSKTRELKVPDLAISQDRPQEMPDEVVELIAVTWRARLERSEILTVQLLAGDDRQSTQVGYDFVSLSPRIGLGTHFFTEVPAGVDRLTVTLPEVNIHQSFMLPTGARGF